MRKFSNAVYLNSSSDAVLTKEPVLLPARNVVSMTISRSPLLPISAPSINPKRCSVSTGSVRVVALSARIGDVAIAIITVAAAAVPITERKTGRNRLPRCGEASRRQRCVRMRTPSLPNPSGRPAKLAGRPHVSDRQLELRWTFRRTGPGADEWSRRDRGDLCGQTAAGCAARDRDHTSQMVVQGTALIAGIAAAVLVLTIMTGVMMVHVIAAAAFGQVGSNIPFALEGMLDVDADQWHLAGGLGPKKQPQEERTEASQLSQRENSRPSRHPPWGRKPDRWALPKSMSLTGSNARPHGQRSLAMRNPSV